MLTSSYPKPGTIIDVKATSGFAAGGSTLSKYLRIWLVNCPSTSLHYNDIINDPNKRKFFAEGDTGLSFKLQADVPGDFTFLVHEINRTLDSGNGGYLEAPESLPTETIVNESNQILNVGQKLTVPFRYQQNVANLSLWVFDGYVAAYEDCPKIRAVGPVTKTFLNAISDGYVTEALNDLVGLSTGDLVGNFATLAIEYIDKYNAHISSSVFHDDDDVFNNISLNFLDIQGSFGSILGFTNVAKQKTQAHMANNNNPSIGLDPVGDDTHFHAVADQENYPLSLNLSSAGEAIQQMAELHLSYERHRVSPVHQAPDDTNALDPLPPLMEVYKLIYEGLKYNIDPMDLAGFV